MTAFKFNDNNITINLLGEEYTADATLAEIEISTAKRRLVEFSQKIESGFAEADEIADNIASTMQSIDAAFGKGSAKKIFKDRRVSLHDCNDIVFYIFAQLNEFEAGKAKLYENYGKNREQRRSK